MSTPVSTESAASTHALPAAAAATKKPRNNSRKPLKQKKDNNIMPEDAALSASKNASSLSGLESELLVMMEKLKIDKEKVEEKLKAKEEELVTKGKEHEKLQIEIKKLQKLKEFKPTVSFPVVQILADKEQGKKKKGGPERKRPSPPYILWCKDQWNEVKKENPNAEFKEIGNILGAKWKTVGAEEKRPYEEKYKAEKEAYLQVVNKEKRESEAMKLLEEEQKQKTAMELLEQYLQFKQESNDNKKVGKKEKDPLKPKHPVSAFLLFSNERRAAHPGEGKSVVEAAKIAGEEWKKMSEKQKAPYEEIAKKNKERYLLEMEAYKQMKEEEAANAMKEEDELMKLQKQEAMQLLKKKEKTENIIKKTKETPQKKKKVQDVDPNKPKKPASSFIIFSKEARKTLAQERPGVNNSTLNALISVKWKELGEEERQVWTSKASEAMDAYKKELLVYNQKLAEEGEVKQN